MMCLLQIFPPSPHGFSAILDDSRHCPSFVLLFGTFEMIWSRCLVAGVPTSQLPFRSHLFNFPPPLCGGTSIRFWFPGRYLFPSSGFSRVLSREVLSFFPPPARESVLSRLILLFPPFVCSRWSNFFRCVCANDRPVRRSLLIPPLY